MRNGFTDLKLIAAGVGLGGLACASFAPPPWAHMCGLVALLGAAFAVTFRQLETK